jgi:hypothetical protein
MNEVSIVLADNPDGTISVSLEFKDGHIDEKSLAQNVAVVAFRAALKEVKVESAAAYRGSIRDTQLGDYFLKKFIDMKTKSWWKFW